MRFSVRDLAETTAFVAAICAVTVSAPNGLLVAAVLLHAGAFLGPAFLGFIAILTCKQNATQLIFPETGILPVMLRLCAYCGAAVAFIWSLVFLVWLYVILQWLLGV